MDTETKYDEDTQESREETLLMSLLSPQDKPQKIKQIIPETSLPSPPPKTPNTATTQPLVPPTNQPLYTPKRPQDFRHQEIYFSIKWARGILTVAASIVFGIRAPLSYEATISDNDTQNIMVTVLSNVKELASTANNIASNALDTASAQHEAMGALLSTIGLMGQQLAVMEFCHGQQTLSVCISYIQEADDSIESLIDQLGYGTVVATATASVVPPAATVDPEGRGVGAVPNAALSPARAPPNMVAFGPSAANLSEPRSSSRATIMYSIPVPTATSSPVECMRYGSTIHEV